MKLLYPVTLGMAALVLGWNADAADAPNILFFLADDLGYSDLACYGNPLHETPNVDRLAAGGMRFTAAYTACAVCSPTRASIQTGQYPIRFGITDWIAGARKPNTPLKEKFTERLLPLEATTLAEAFKQHGYATAFIGKWHLNDQDHATGFPEDQGYDVNIGGHHKGSPPGGYFAPFKNPRMEDKPGDHYLTDRLGDEAIRLIDGFTRNPDTPFFLMLSFYTVHTPIQPKPELKEYYEEKLKQNPSPYWKNPAYAAMVHSLDENVGRVLEALEAHQMAEDTIVVFFSDNGGLEWFTSCHPLSRGKGYYHEGGIRVPLIIRKPGQVTAGSESSTPAISNDLFPTLLELAGLPLLPDAHKDGLSLVPVFRGGSLPREALYWHYPHYHGAGETPASAIRLGDYKFIRHYEDNQRELYDLSRDISETNNLVTAMPDKADTLEQALDRWLTARNAYIPGPDPEFDPSQPIGKRPPSSRKAK
jgi:arylsulfatase A-like enzyme